MTIKITVQHTEDYIYGAETVQYQNGATDTTLPNLAFIKNVQGICPTGWHIPSQTEFQTLSTTTVDSNGNAVKAVGQGTGTNTSGFSALIAGDRYYANSYFYWLGGLGWTLFWSTLEYNDYNAYYMFLYSDARNIHWGYDSNNYNGLSVRCIKDN